MAKVHQRVPLPIMPPSFMQTPPLRKNPFCILPAMHCLLRVNVCMPKTHPNRILRCRLQPRRHPTSVRGLHTIVPDTTLPDRIPEPKQTPAAAHIGKLFSLQGRKVVITGAGRGLGIALATAVAECGGEVVCLDVLSAPQKKAWETIQKVSEASNLRPVYLQCDITDEESVESTLKKATAPIDGAKRPLQGLVRCAGIQQMLDAIGYPVPDFRRILDVNVVGSFIVAKHAARLMKDAGSAGSIVLVASMSGQIANRGIHCSAYNTSKSAVHQMCRSLAAEWGQHGIRVNTLSPGYIRTAMTDQLLADKPDLEKLWMAGAVLNRLGAPEDFKAAVVYLLADGSSFMTGSDLRVDGGHCASA